MKKKTARQRSTAKGHAAVAMARRIFEARGAIMESAPNVVRWIPAVDATGGAKMIPRSMRHDFFGVWDLIVVEPASLHMDRPTFFVQVTEVGHLSHRRTKILESGFPTTVLDLVMGYRGRGVFRVLRGPRFEGEGEEWKVPAPGKKVPNVPEW